MWQVGISITGGLSYLRVQQQTQEQSQAWALALARLAAKSSAGPVYERDYGTLEVAIEEIAGLPGVVSVRVSAPGGQAMLQVLHEDDGHVRARYPKDERHQGPDLLPPAHPHQVAAHASLISSSAGRPGAPADLPTLQNEGWVEVIFSHRDRQLQSYRNWMSDALGVLATTALGLLVFYAVLQRAIRPVGELARFANRLAKRPGDNLNIRWRSREVRELGHAINWASRELAQRMEDTQRQLARLHAVLGTAADAIIGVSAQGQIVMLNPAAERMFGCPGESLQGQSLTTVLSGMDVPQLQESLAAGNFFSGTQSRFTQVEWTGQRQHGTPFPVELLIGETQGDPDIGFTCIVRDLTEVKEAQAHLALYGRVVDCTLNGIMISDARQALQPITHVNPAFTRITGYSAADAQGRPANLLAGPSTDPDAQALIDSAMRNGQEFTLTLIHHRQDGSTFHDKLAVSPVRDVTGEITHYITVIEDVSSAIDVKRKLIERTARLNATFNLSPDGFAVFDAQGSLVTTNPALREMVGQIPTWCTLQRFDVWFRNLCEDYDAYPSVLSGLNETSQRVLVLSHPTHRVLEREIRRNLGGSGETFLYFRDITHQFEVSRMKSEFLATAAHELRTPLASILGFTELMIHRRYSEEKQKDLLQTVHRQGTLLSNLIQELLDLSRIEARQGKDFHIVPTRLDEIVTATVKGFSNHAAGQGVDVGPLPEWLVMADATKIQQALTNLLSNAFKYSPGTPQVRLDVHTSREGGQGLVHICVHDRGMGMSANQLARAFERFYRADASGHVPGTGLGLDLVEGIVVLGNDIESKTRYVVYCLYLVQKQWQPLYLSALNILDEMFSQYGYLADHVDKRLFEHILSLVVHPAR